MVKENSDHSSDSSDEDFCPDKVVAEESDALSSDNEDEEESEDEENVESTSQEGKKKTSNTKSPAKHDTAIGNRRSTRQTAGDEKNKGREKDTLDEEDENEKSRTDALWADFLSDVQPEKNVDEKVTPSSSVSSKDSSSKVAAGNVAQPAKSPNVKNTCNQPANDKPKPTTTTVTEVVDFAGEEVRVQRTVTANSVKENKTTPSNKTPIGLKRLGSGIGGGGSGGLGGILNQIGKKKKLSVLEKTKLDWNSFKEEAGLDEELKTHNKGKDGYLERQDFLQRTDLRQFEIEKSLRQTTRRPQ